MEILKCRLWLEARAEVCFGPVVTSQMCLGRWWWFEEWVVEFPRLWALVFWCSGVLVVLEVIWVEVVEVP